MRAAYVGITNGRFSEGASTITQQLIKNNVLQGGYETSMADKLRRKIQEQFLAVKLEDQLDSKETILEYYLNTINLGGQLSWCTDSCSPLFWQKCMGINII